VTDPRTPPESFEKQATTKMPTPSPTKEKMKEIYKLLIPTKKEKKDALNKQ